MTAPGSRGKAADRIMAEAADYWYDVAELYEDDDLDPDDHAEVIGRAFTSSHCDLMAEVMREITGWPIVWATWTKHGQFCHHALNRAPDGRLVDVMGWTTEDEIRKRYKAGKAKFVYGRASSDLAEDHVEDDGTYHLLGMLVDVIRCLPHAPFTEQEFREMSMAEIPGVDAPVAGIAP